MTLETVPRYDETLAGTWGDRAVVVGASVAGLLAARVLRDGFERVTVLDHSRTTRSPGAACPRGVTSTS